MKTRNFIVLLIVFALLSTATVAANPQGPPTHRGPRDPTFRPNGFVGQSEYLNITGEINVEDSILLTITVTPTPEAIEQIENHRTDLPVAMRDPDNMSNTITISITQIVEFNDTLDDGYTADDAILSTYVLNSSTLNDVTQTTVDETKVYTITSTTSGLFTMTAELNYEQGIINAWKWSFDINYPFTSNTSKLAVINEVDRTHYAMMEQYREKMPNNGNAYRYNATHMSSCDTTLPVFLQWDDYAIVDGVNTTVVATGDVGTTIALAFEQGNTINYDPRIGIDSSSIIQTESIFQELVSNFLASINSPTVLGITIAFVVSIAIMMYGISRRK